MLLQSLVIPHIGEVVSNTVRYVENPEVCELFVGVSAVSDVFTAAVKYAYGKMVKVEC